MKIKYVCGVGINDMLHPTRNEDGGMQSWYSHWKRMLTSCYSNKELVRYPSYRGCSVCDEWIVASKFKVWFDENYVEGWHLDKDLLLKGNKVYSPVACMFIPPRINTMITQQESSMTGIRTRIGVAGVTYQVRLKDKGKEVNLGTFSDLKLARKVRLEYKNTILGLVIKEQEVMYKLSSKALHNLKVISSITFM